MKKILALLLTVVLLCTSLFTAIPVFATTENSKPINATPLTGYTISYPFYQVVTAKSVTPAATEKFVTAEGIKITSKTVEAYSETAVKNSRVLAQGLYNSSAINGYALPENFATDGSFIVYVKVTSANKMYFLYTTTYGANHTTSGEIIANASYQFTAVGSDVWTDAVADENGFISFDGAFEGYLKIPATSTKSVDNIAMTFKGLGSIGARFEGIGGEYGEIDMGPFFITTEDSTSTKINVPDEFKPEPINASPLTGYTISYPFYQVVTAKSVTPDATKKFVAAEGMKITSSTAEAYSEAAVKNSKALAQAMYNSAAINGYALPENFATDGSFIVYVKVSSANKMYFLYTTTYGANHTTSGEIKANASYEYVAVGDDVWTDAVADENGFISFDGAFEGYLKIPATSTKSVDNITMTFKGLGSFGARFEGIGGEYGEIDMGPFFVTTDDSKSTKINVPDEFKPQPIKVTPLVWSKVGKSYYYDANFENPQSISNLTAVNGVKITQNGYGQQDRMGKGYSSNLYINNDADTFELPTDFTQKGSIIMYVKTDAANELVLMTRTNNGKLTKIKANGSYEYANCGDEYWSSSVADDKGVISFDSAFDGMIKIPATSIVNYDYNTSMTFDKFTYFDVRVGGVGGTFGNVTVGPFFVTTDSSASAKLDIPEEYKPQPLEIKSFDFREVRASGYNYSADLIEGTNNYKLYINEKVVTDTPVKHQAGVEKWSYVENEDGKVASGGSTPLIMTPTVDTYMKDAVGMVFYVKFSKANKFSPSLNFVDAKGSVMAYMLKPGQSVYVLENGSEEWTEKTVEAGYVNAQDVANSLIYGMVSFDEAFEGYIKVPFTSCNNDSGFKPTFTGDNMTALTNIAIRFKGIGDDTMYGKEVVVGVTGYYTADTSRPAIGNVSAPEYENGDVNYDWKVDSADLVSARKSLVGYKGYTGYTLTLVDLVKLKKLFVEVK